MYGSRHSPPGTSRLILAGVSVCLGLVSLTWLGLSPGRNKEQSRPPQHPDTGAYRLPLARHAMGTTARGQQSQLHLLQWYLDRLGTLSPHRPTSPSLQRTADHLASFLASGQVEEIRGVSRADIGSFVDFVTEEFGRADIEEFSWLAARVPPEIIPARKPALKKFLSGWFEALQGPEASPAASPGTADPQGHNASIQNRANDQARNKGAVTCSQSQGSQESMTLAPVDLGFAGELDEYGQVLSTAPTFKEGTSTIYAVFENKGAVAGLSHVLAIWRDEASNVTFQECESIHTSTRSNYVWLSPDDGWPRGSYRLEIYDPNDSFTIVGRGKFAVE
jgi:hypothetical protein